MTAKNTPDELLSVLEDACVRVENEPVRDNLVAEQFGHVCGQIICIMYDSGKESRAYEVSLDILKQVNQPIDLTSLFDDYCRFDNCEWTKKMSEVLRQMQEVVERNFDATLQKSVFRAAGRYLEGQGYPIDYGPFLVKA